MKISDSSDLGKLVRESRKRAGLSQTELAQLVGTTRQWLSRFEQGSNDVSLGSAFAVLDALDLTIESMDPTSTTETISTESTSSVPQPELAELSYGDHPTEAPAPDVVVGQTKPLDRASRLRQRDALSGLRIGQRASEGTVPLPTSRARRVVPPVGAKGSALPKSGQVQNGQVSTDQAPGTNQSPTSPATAPNSSSAASARAYSIEADIARISQSSLFKKNRS